MLQCPAPNTFNDNVQVSQCSQASLDLFSQSLDTGIGQMQSQNNKGFCGNEENELKSSTEIKQHHCGHPTFNKFYMKYISLNTSNEKSRALDESYETNYQTWKKDLAENKYIIDAISKTSEDCATQISKAVDSLKQSIQCHHDKLQQDLIMKEDHTRQIIESAHLFEEKTTQESGMNKQELSELREKLQQCMEQFSKLEAQLQCHMTSSQNRFDKLCLLMNNIIGELQTLSHSSHCCCDQFNATSKSELSQTVLVSPYAKIQNHKEKVIRKVKKYHESKCGSKHYISTTSPYKCDHSIQSPLIQNGKKRNHKTIILDQCMAVKQETPMIRSYMKRVRQPSDTSDEETNTIFQPLTKQNGTNSITSRKTDENAFLTSPSSISLERKFQRSSEAQKRQALIKTMVPGSECLLKEIQSYLVHGINNAHS